MEPTDEFRDFGKKIPYQEPAGFFEEFSEKTLQQAKRRELSRKKKLVLWRTVTVAASLSGLALLGYFMFEPERPEHNSIVFENQSVGQQIIQEQEITKQPKIAEIEKTIPEKVPEKIEVKEIDNEDIGDVLADLSDEELLEMSAMYKADPFMSESEQ